jgi:hypothetical protein
MAAERGELEPELRTPAKKATASFRDAAPSVSWASFKRRSLNWSILTVSSSTVTKCIAKGLSAASKEFISHSVWISV